MNAKYHINKFRSLDFFVLIILSISNLSCDSSTEPFEPAVITYTVSGGFAGGIHTKLVIDQSGVASLETEYPVLKQQLGQVEFNSLLKLFVGFSSFSDSYYGGCVDVPIYAIEYNNGRLSKKVEADRCAFSDSTNFEISKIRTIVDRLSEIVKQVRENKGEWIGLTAEYKIDKNIYMLGKTVNLTFILRNPTDKKRTLYFKDQYQFNFRITKTDYPLMYYRYPGDLQTNPADAGKITLNAGEEKTISYAWDQNMSDNNRNKIPAPAGLYSIVMFFAGNKVNTSDNLFFDIVDPAIPITGRVMADPNGESNEANSYSFNLFVKNWTASPVTLNFPNSQKLSVQLFDADIPSNKVLIYESPIEHDNITSQTVLQPGSEKTFSYSISKDKLSLGKGFWYYTKIKLLCSDFNFTKDAEIRIFNY